MSNDQYGYDNLKLEELWEKLCSGDQKALEVLFKRNFDSLYSYGYRIISNTDRVRDAIQEVFYQLWKYRNNLDKPTSVEAYLFISLRRQLLRKKKDRSRREEIDKKYMAEEFDPLLNYESWQQVLELKNEKRSKLKKAVSELTPRQREVIYLKYFEGLSTEELVDILEVRAQSIYNLVHNAIESLRTYLDN